jgi:hypothetical protein
MNNTYKVKSGTDYTLDSKAYRLTEVKLTPNNSSNQLDIKDQVVRIDIEESLFNPVVQLQIIIVDTTSMLEKYKLNGGERIKLTVDRKAPPTAKTTFDVQTDGEYEKWEYDFAVSEIYNVVRNEPTKQFFTIRAMPLEFFHNASKVLDRAFTGSPAQIVSKIIKSDLKSTKYNVDIDSKSTVSGIFPRVRPFKAITWLSKSSFDNGTPFFFYASSREGMQYTSYENLLKDKEKPFATYVFKPFFEAKEDDVYEEALYRVRSLSSPLNIGKAANMLTGVYASNMHVVDTSTKSYRKFEYKHQPDKMQSLNEFKPYNQPKDIDAIDEMAGARTLYMCKNDMSYADADNLYGPSGATFLKSVSYRNGLGYIKHFLQVDGNFNLQPGMIIKLDIQRVGDRKQVEEDPDQKQNMMRDELMTGNYMITEIKSRFTDDGFTMSLTVQSDSSAIDLNIA